VIACLNLMVTLKHNTVESLSKAKIIKHERQCGGPQTVTMRFPQKLETRNYTQMAQLNCEIFRNFIPYFIHTYKTK
jgi:hypothetical protein